MTRKVPVPRSDIRVETFVLNVPEYDLVFHVTTHSSDRSIVYYFGSFDMYCAVCQVHFSGTPMDRIIDTSIANLSNFDFDELCCLNRRFQRGNDTRTLFRVVMGVIRQRHPHIRGMSFTDKSERVCDNGSSVSLSLMHYLVNEKTWYMNHFDAVMDDVGKQKLADAVERLNGKKMSWDVFYELTMRSNLPGITQSELKYMYEDESKSNVLAYLKAVAKKVRVSHFCVYISDWITNFMAEHFKYGFHDTKFVIYFNSPKAQVLSEFTIDDQQTGGGIRKKQTRKQRNRKFCKVLYHPF